MKTNTLTFFIFSINAAIDTGKFQGITIDEVVKHLEKRNLLVWLRKEHLTASILSYDFSPIQADSEELEEQLSDLAGAYNGKKFGVEKSGLCYLIALATELIQRG